MSEKTYCQYLDQDVTLQLFQAKLR